MHEFVDPRDKEYLELYRAWVGSLSPRERRRLEVMGLDEPRLDGRVSGALRGSTEDGPEVRECVDLWQDGAPGEDVVLEGLQEAVAGLSVEQSARVLRWCEARCEARVKREAADLLQRVVAFLIQPGLNYKLVNWALCFATGLDVVAGAKSQNAVALRLGESRQLLGHYVSKWRDQLGYHVMKFCRREAVREVYAARASRVHADRAQRVERLAGGEVSLEAVGE